MNSGQGLGGETGNGVALGDLDAVVTTDTNASAIVWLNQGGTQGGTEGEFVAGETLGSASGYGVTTGDVDNDGDLDAVVVGNSNQVWLNDGDGTFTARPAFPYQFGEAVVLADLDEDGTLDTVIADSATGSSNRVWWNDGNWDSGPGSFTAGDLLPTTSLIPGAVVGNLDEDNLQDIFLVGDLLLNLFEVTTALDDDYRIFNAMTRLFNASPGGQGYVALYRQHGAEMGRIGLQDFAGMSFSQWARAIGVQPPVKMLFTPVIVRDQGSAPVTSVT